ncbi:MAG: TraR/DksA family transcriptional regulator [Candidatus Magasanikbacteria bacterium]|nr:TraR/DksA family transcriptional regulator [Candidatus Magasanikbacteria bacterium]
MTAQTTKLSQKFIDEMKMVLLEEKDRLESELSKFSKKNPHVAGDYETSYEEFGDKSDENAQEITQYLTDKPLEIQLEGLLNDVEKALTRISKGAYGVCKYCDQTIEEKRLIARPTSSACVSCKKTLTQEL